MTSLDLGLVGNGTIGCLVNAKAELVWGCFPRFDADPTFCSLLQPRGEPGAGHGYFSIELADQAHVNQEYVANTAIIVTRLYDRSGGCIEVRDFAPRFRQHGRLYCPMMVVRHVRRVAGNPRVRVRMRAACDYGRYPAPLTHGSNHIRALATDGAIRLTTDAPVTAILEETLFYLDDEVALVLGPDETLPDAPREMAHRMFDETSAYWRDWVRSLAVPFEWQEAVIRAAITLELNVYEDTGAVIAAMTTSIPESPFSGRTWDYRFCWVRDAYFVVNALNRLGATRTMERYLGFVLNIVADAKGGALRPMYGISAGSLVEERVVDSLAGYRGMGPVRRGNAAFQQVQHDAYGSAILAAAHVFFDRRLDRRGDAALFRRIETLGESAARLFDKPDAGIWELRGEGQVHTFSSVMCWAACDRLARIAEHIGLTERAAYWRGQAATIHDVVSARCWNDERQSFVGTMDGTTLDASLLRLHEVGFLSARDPRFARTVTAIGRDLRRGDFIFRYVDADDFGLPENAFVVCTFWYVNALAAIGRREEARELFEMLLQCRTRHGLMAEHIDPRTREPWGNFVQTYSMVGLISSAIRLSVRWDQAF